MNEMGLCLGFESQYSKKGPSHFLGILQCLQKSYQGLINAAGFFIVGLVYLNLKAKALKYSTAEFLNLHNFSLQY